MNRTESVIKSIVSGGVNRIVSLLLPFIIRTVVIQKLGIDYLGLNSVFSSILSILSFSELGFGNVMVYSFYEPIARNDTKTVCALYSLYRKIYRIIGLVMLSGGLIIMPFIGYFVSGEYPADVNLYILYLIFLFNTVISYWLFSYKNSLLAAHQQYYVSNSISLIVMVAKSIAEIVVLCVFSNYYLYIIVLPISTVINNLITSAEVNKRYPDIKCAGTVEPKQAKDIMRTVGAGIGHKLGPTATTSVDNLIISSYLGVTILGIYSNYTYVQTAVAGFITIVFSSMTAGIGNALVTKNMEENYRDFRRFSFLSFWLVGGCSACLLGLYQPFMEIWVGTGKMYSGYSTIVLLTIMFYTQEIRQVVTTYKSAAGLWRADKFKPYVATIANLILDLVFVRIWGINGVILTTIIARAMIGLPWESYALYRYLFQRSVKEYYLWLLKYTAIWAALVSVTFAVCLLIPVSGLGAFIIRLPICLFLPNGVFYLLFAQTDECKYLVNKLKCSSHKFKK